jgi:hypothetical protein
VWYVRAALLDAPSSFGFAGHAQIAIGAFPKLTSVVPEKG